MVKASGVDATFAERWEVVRRIQNGSPVKRIARTMGRSAKFVRTWRDRKDEVLKEGSVHSKRKGAVGRHPKFSQKESDELAAKLMGTSQTALATKVDCTRKTLRKHTRRKHKTNPSGSFPYAPKTTPRATPRTKLQAYNFTKNSIIGKVARGSDNYWKRVRKQVCFIDHTPLKMSGKINRTHDPQWRTPAQMKRFGISPSSNSSKNGSSYQAFTCMSWNSRALHLHVRRRRKKKTWNAKPHYKLEKESVTGAAVVEAIETTLGPAMETDGIKWVIADNDGKLHQKQVKDAWAQFGIKLYPGSGQRCWDREEGGFPVDFPKLMPLDRTLHHRWKNSKNGGLYAIFNARDKRRRTTGGFINDTYNSWENIPQKTFQNAIEGCRKIYTTCYNNEGDIIM